MYWSLFTPDKKGINEKFYKKATVIGLDGIDPLIFKKSKVSLSALDLSYDILKEWQGRISFLSLPDRVDYVNEEVDKDLSDTAMLKLLVKAMKQVEKASSKR